MSASAAGKRTFTWRSAAWSARRTTAGRARSPSGCRRSRRGRPRWRKDEKTGEYVLLADRWHTCFYDLSGTQGMLGQAGGRTADDAAY